MSDFNPTPKKRDPDFSDWLMWIATIVAAAFFIRYGFKEFFPALLIGKLS